MNNANTKNTAEVKAFLAQERAARIQESKDAYDAACNSYEHDSFTEALVNNIRGRNDYNDYYDYN